MFYCRRKVKSVYPLLFVLLSFFFIVCDARAGEHYLSLNGLTLVESKPSLGSDLQLQNFLNLDFEGPVSTDTAFDSCDYSFWMATTETSCDIQFQLFLDPSGTNTLISSSQFTITGDTYREYTATSGTSVNSISSGSDIALRMTSSERCAGILFGPGKEPYFSLDEEEPFSFNLIVSTIASQRKDCNGDVRGDAVTDNCGRCVGGRTGRTACTQDCNGDWGGSAVVDECGVCGGPGGPCPDCRLTCSSTGFSYSCGSGRETTRTNYCYVGSRGYVESINVDYNNGYTVSCTSDSCGGPLTCRDNTGQTCTQ